MGPFLRAPGAAGDPGIVVPSTVETALQGLDARNNALYADGAYCKNPEVDLGNKNNEHCTYEDYASVISGLRPAFCHATRGLDKLLMLAWMVMVPVRFINALRERKPLALAIVAHYGVALHVVRDNWFVNDLGKRVVGAVSAALGEEWNDVMAWTKEEVGLI